MVGFHKQALDAAQIVVAGWDAVKSAGEQVCVRCRFLGGCPLTGFDNVIKLILLSLTHQESQDAMSNPPAPTDRELEILKILWDRGEATVREVYEELSQNLPIVQNTVQAFLRTMEDKGHVCHRVEGRTFIYQPVIERESTNTRLASRLLQRVFDGAIDQLVHSLFSERTPTEAELQRLEELIAELKTSRKPSGRQKRRSK